MLKLGFFISRRFFSRKYVDDFNTHFSGGGGGGGVMTCHQLFYSDAEERQNQRGLKALSKCYRKVHIFYFPFDRGVALPTVM